MRWLSAPCLVFAAVVGAPILPAEAASHAGGVPRPAIGRGSVRPSSANPPPSRVQPVPHPMAAPAVSRGDGRIASGPPRLGTSGGDGGRAPRFDIGAYARFGPRRSVLPVFSPGIGNVDPGDRRSDDAQTPPDVSQLDVDPAADLTAPPGVRDGFPPPPRYGFVRRPHLGVRNPGPRIITVGAPRKDDGRPLPRIVYGWTPGRRTD